MQMYMMEPPGKTCCGLERIADGIVGAMLMSQTVVNENND